MSIAQESAGPLAPASGSSPILAQTLLLSLTLGTFMAASSAPTPLYRLYQQHWGFSPLVLTEVFAIYAAGILASLLTVGALSDYIGRRPMIRAALVLEALALALFLVADDVPWLMAARALQGFATGAATAVLGAAILDRDPVRGPMINGLVAPVGMALGGLGTGALVTLGPDPTHLTYAILLGALLLQGLSLWFLPESISPRPGAWASLRPRLQVSPGLRPALARVMPINLAAWTLGGFCLSLMPTVMQGALGSEAPLVGGLTVATLTLSGALAIVLLHRHPAPKILTIGGLGLVAGMATVLVGVHLGQLALLLGGLLTAGFGWGAGFLGALRTILPLAAPGERAGLMSVYYVQSYLFWSLPAIAAGSLMRTLGLVPTADLYGAVVLGLAVLGLGLGHLRPGRA